MIDIKTFIKFLENKTYINLNKIDGIKFNTKKKNFYKFLNKLDKETSVLDVQILNKLIDIFIIKENGIFLDSDYSENILNNSIKKLKKFYENNYEISSIEDYSLLQNTHNSSAKKIYNIFQFFSTEIDSIIPENIIINKNQEYFSNLDLNIYNELIIIENSECFFRYKEFLNNKYFENLPEMKNILIIYGSGNKITSKRLNLFFNNFNKIHCFFDYDEDGFKFYNAIKHNNKINYIPKKEILNLIINKIYEYSKKFNKILKYTNINNEEYLSIYKENIHYNGKIIQIEQETLLLKDLNEKN